MSAPQVALSGLVFGVLFAVGFMGAYAARAAYSMTRQHHWHQLKQL